MKILSTIIISTILLNPTFGQFKGKIEVAEEAFKKHEFINAILLYDSILKETDFEYYHYVLFKKAYCNYHLANYKEAIIDIKKAIKIDKLNLDYNWIMGNSYWLYGRIYSKLNKERASLKYLKEASKYFQTSLLFSTIGFKQIQLGQYKKALKNLNIAIQLDETNAFAYSNRSLVYLKHSAFNEARNDINKSIQLDNKNPYAFKHSAMIYIKMKEFKNACIELHKAEELGYAKFGNESDSSDVETLIKKYCKTISNKKCVTK